MRFIEQLNAVVEELRSNPEIYVAHYAVLPPDVDAIAEVETALGYELDASITDFYKTCGGIQLLWMYRNNEDFEQKKAYLEEELASRQYLEFGMFYGGMGMMKDGASWDELITDGVILIPPIKTSFLDQSYNDNTDEYGVDTDMFEDYELFDDLESLKTRKFDMYDLSVNTAFILNNDPYPAMLTAYDNQEYADAAVIYFKEYLALLLASKGARKRGHDFLLASDFTHQHITMEMISEARDNGLF